MAGSKQLASAAGYAVGCFYEGYISLVCKEEDSYTYWWDTYTEAQAHRDRMQKEFPEDAYIIVVEK
jgi:hypothetical protein